MVPKNPECLAFGKTVRIYRKQAGYSQEELANRAEIHRTYIGGIERGERNPTLTMIYRLARALGVSPHHLLKEPPPPVAQENTCKLTKNGGN
jgi:transcriptional regulator with XRE-family HTH domain